MNRIGLGRITGKPETGTGPLGKFRLADITGSYSGPEVRFVGDHGGPGYLHWLCIRSDDTRPKSSDFGQPKLTKIEYVESATCGVRKDGVFGQASSKPRRLIQGGSRMRRSARTVLCGGRSVMVVPTASVEGSRRAPSTRVPCVWSYRPVTNATIALAIFSPIDEGSMGFA
jgi:hypothetical protein